MTKKLKFTILLATLAVCLSIGVALLGKNHVSAEVSWSEVAIENSYLSGDSLDIPSRKIAVDGNEYDATTKLIRPDGSATSAKSVVLSAAGKYTVQYYATIDGKTYLESVSFVVREKAFVYSDEETTATYGTGVYTSSPNAEGLYVQLREQDSIEFRQIITIPSVNEDISLLNYFIAPSELESADFSKITFTLTDVKDSSCYLQIVAQSPRADTGDGRGGCYLLAGGSGQQLKGNQNGTIHVNNSYGARSNQGSFFGYKVAGWSASEGFILESVDPSTLGITLKFNPVTCEVKADNTVIIDTDSKTYYGGASDVKWTGFSSGSVRLSIKCEGYNKSSANLFLTNVKDVDLSSDSCTDTLPPEITIQSEYDLNDMPNARVGANEYYTIPTATAYDLTTGACDVHVAVYKDFGLESEARVNVVGNKFNTDSEGSYAIVYTATDAFGNAAERQVVYVTAEENMAAISFEISGLEDSYEAGNKIVVPFPVVSGGSGKKTISALVSFGETSYSFTAADDVWEFYPEKAGDWQLVYFATDYTEHTETKAYIIPVVSASKPTFRENPAFPNAFVSGLGNKLPDLTAYDYTSDSLVTAVADVSVSDKTGTKTFKAGDIFIPSVENNGDTISVTYSYNNGKSSVRVGPFAIPVIVAYKDDNLAVDNYFLSTGETTFTKEVTDNGIKITSAAGNHAWAFANNLVANGFSLTFGGVKDVCVYNKMVVGLKDSVNSAQSLKVIFERSASGKITLSCGFVSDSVSTSTINAKDGSVIQSITVGFSGSRLLVNGYAYDIDKYEDGSAFNGFSSGMLSLAFSVQGAEEGAIYYVSEINSYTITRARQDRTAPYISVTGDYGGFYSNGDEYTIHSAVAADVLAPVVDFTLTVKAPDGTFATAVDGTILNGVDPSLEYTVKLSSYGTYTVIYTAVENNAPRLNTNEYSYEIIVEDDEAPTFTTNGNAPTTAAKGDTIVLPKYAVRDNVSASENIVSYVVVRNPNGRRTIVSGDSLKCDYVGEYEVSYYFTDEAGNVSVYRFQVIVK